MCGSEASVTWLTYSLAPIAVKFPSPMMKITTLIFISLILCVTVAGQDQQAQLEMLRSEGYQALYNLDYEGARNRFQKMMELAPEHPAGAQCMASSVWVQQLNDSWKLKASLYSTSTETKDDPKIDRKQVDEFRKWTRRAKALSEARLKKDPRDLEALYFLGATQGLEAAFLGGVERKFMAAFRAGTDAVDQHRKLLKLAPDFRDAELTIGLQNYIIGSLPLAPKMLAAAMGVRGSKKRGLEALERVAAEGKWARDVARVLLVDLYKREKRWDAAGRMARELSEKFPRNYIFRLQIADALASEILALKKAKTPVQAKEKELHDMYAALLRDKTYDISTRDLIQSRWTTARQQLITQ